MPFDRLGRRDFITLLGGAATAWPLATHAQQPAMPVVGFPRFPAALKMFGPLAQFRERPTRSDYVGGRTWRSTYRWADGDLDRLPLLATELVASRSP